MMGLQVEKVSAEQMVDLLSTSTETKRVEGIDLLAKWLDTPAGQVIVVEGYMGGGLKFTH